MTEDALLARAESVLRGEMGEIAEAGGVIDYRGILTRICCVMPDCPIRQKTALMPVLDAINETTCKQGYLLSSVVVGRSGIPDAGFFEKLELGKWQPRIAEVNADPYAVFRGELTLVYDQFAAPRKIAMFFDLESLASSHPDMRYWAIDAVSRLHSELTPQALILPPLAFCKDPTGIWGYDALARLKEAGLGLKIIRAPSDAMRGASAADMVLVGEWSSSIVKGYPLSAIARGIILTPRDVVCLFGDDSDYHAPVLQAKSAGFEVWGFGDGRRNDEKITKYRASLRFFDLCKPDTWDFSL